MKVLLGVEDVAGLCCLVVCLRWCRCGVVGVPEGVAEWVKGLWPIEGNGRVGGLHASS